MAKIHSRPHGRKMPHPHEAKNEAGAVDLEKAKAALPGVVHAFESGEYLLVDMDEGLVDTAEEIAALSKLGSKAAMGDEYFIVIRRQGAKAA